MPLPNFAGVEDQQLAREVLAMVSGSPGLKPLPTLAHVRFLVGVIEQLELECATTTGLALELQAERDASTQPPTTNHSSKVLYAS